MTEKTVENLRRAKSGDKQAAEALIEENSGLIWSVARRFFGRGTEPDDLYQLGCVGFLKAIEGFDCTYGTRFSTYAVPKISGEIRRFLRDDGAMKVSRSVKELGYRVHTARETLHQTLSRPPTIHEIANWLEVSPEEIAACETALLPPDSLQREIGEDGTTLEQILGEACMEERVVESLALREAMERLDVRSQRILLLRYFRGQTQQTCARQLGISQVQVSRLEKKAVQQLRKWLAQE